ncbi:MAG: hypothetical protein KKH75_08840, partial [Actinobacteria bacterium]|nr:hypothetical protein [Actinomycetota bacterium]
MTIPAETSPREASHDTSTTRAACSYCGVGCGVTVSAS